MMRSKSRKQRYILDHRPLGSGGQAQVFKAQDRLTGRIVALKQVLYRDAEAIARMRREIEVQAALSHPNIMSIIDHSANYHWYTMPLADQVMGNLKTPVDDELLLTIVEDCARGLSLAHDNGFVHRDVSPNNIMLLNDEQGSRWVVSDWGLVRRYGQTTVARTIPGQPLGTLGFASPEMWEDAHSVEGRADVYSLGRVVAWAVTGKSPAPNMPLLPDGKWREFVQITIELDYKVRLSGADIVLDYLSLAKGNDFLVMNDHSPEKNTAEPIINVTNQETDSADYLYRKLSIPKLLPVEAKYIIAKRSREVLLTLDQNNIEAFSRFVHPSEGVRFSPYAFVEESSIVLTQDQVLNYWSAKEKFVWGHYDGTGFPIRATFKEYYKQFVYSQEFLEAERVGYNEIQGTGNTPSNAFEFYPTAIVVEYYFIGFNPKYSGMDWESLRLVYEELNDVWYIVGVIHDNWTI